VASTDRDLEARLGYTFRDPELLDRALTHRSWVAEAGLAAGDQNERLEFLGDAVVQLVVSDLLLTRQPDATEGELSQYRSQLVRQASLAAVARDLGFGDRLRLGVGEARSGGRDKASILCAAYEAVIGAIYQEAGLAAAREMVEHHLGPRTPGLGARGWPRDAKTALQEISQERWRLLPSYELVEATGPDHDRRYRFAVWIGDHRLGEGEGSSKKAAEQAAASAALERLSNAADR
jgi:ribonuclease-3